PRSSSITRTPARARAIADAMPAAPAPTTSTSEEVLDSDMGRLLFLQKIYQRHGNGGCRRISCTSRRALRTGPVSVQGHSARILPSRPARVQPVLPRFGVAPHETIGHGGH